MTTTGNNKTTIFQSVLSSTFFALLLGFGLMQASLSAQAEPIENQSAQTQTETVNINTADAEQLAAKLSGIGSVKASAIVAYRSENGLFVDAAQLMNVPGIGQKTFAKIKDRILL